jgi:hypothetical protein
VPQVGEEAQPVSGVAAELGVCWWTVVNAVIEHGKRVEPPVGGHPGGSGVSVRVS